MASSSPAQRKFGADLRRSYFAAEEGVLRVLDTLDAQAEASSYSSGTAGAQEANVKAMENLARDSGRLLRRWQRSSSLATEAATLLLAEMEALRAERARLDAVLNARTELLAQSFEENAYVNDCGVKLQHILKSS